MGLRIISGRLKGKKLRTLPGSKTRPTSDRLRETLFNILGSRIKNACILDLYAGSGALGIEALSREARFSMFIDNDGQAMAVIKGNLRACSLDEKSKTILWDIRKNLNCMMAIPEMFDMVFMDPPYLKGMIFDTLRNLEETGKLAAGASLVVEHASKEPVRVDSPNFTITDRRTYGKTSLTFLRYG
jgi:16S rRNA (guanine966-N2)-methyltransferase